MANIKDLIQSIESGDSSFDEKLAAINEMEETLVAMRAQEQSAIDDNVAMIVEAIAVMQRKVEAQLEVAKAIVPEIGPMGPKGAPGERGLDGANGRDGRDGADGRNGVDGQDGVSVTDAKIDFDGSLVITLSTGREINVGEVVAPDLAEKIKLVTSGGSTSQQVLDAIAAIEATLATYGTMALQNANSVAITGGTINGATIGSTTPAAATFTTLTATGQTSLGGAAGSDVFRVLRDNTFAGSTTASFTAPQFSFIPPQTGFGAAVIGLGLNPRINSYGTDGQYFATNQSAGFAGTVQAKIAHTASAVNYVQVTGAATGASPTISVQGSDASAGLVLLSKSASIIFQTRTAQGRSFNVLDTGAPVNYLQVQGSTTGNQPFLTSQGTDPNIALGISSKGAGIVGLYTNGGIGQLVAAHTASAVNYVQVTGAVTGGPPVISAQGSDATIALLYGAKGGQDHRFFSNAGNAEQFRVIHTAGTMVNQTTATGSATGVAPAFSVRGSDPNIDLALTPKGTGNVRFGTYTASMAFTVQGYIEIKDSGGTVRKLAVVA